MTGVWPGISEVRPGMSRIGSSFDDYSGAGDGVMVSENEGVTSGVEESASSTATGVEVSGIDTSDRI